MVVCGGGLAGFCAAVAAAREGAKTCLIQNRPVLGGNSSSEIGVTPHGAAAWHAYARETGIISELLLEERSRNHARINENGWTNSVWDMVMYDMAVATPNLTVHLNTDVVAVLLTGEVSPREDRGAAGDVGIELGYYHRPALHDQPVSLDAVVARQQSAELELTIQGKTFIDCTGDGLVADRAGCEWRMGTESQDEFGEPHAPKRASTDTMGSSIHFRTRHMGRPCPYTAPEWAVKHEDASYFYEQGRPPNDERGGYWWLEIGVPHHTLHDNESIRHELTRHALGVWDWMKNRDPVMMQRTKDYALDWIGQVPGKRESRRIMGRYLVTEKDIQERTIFEDEIAYGGWFVDLHTPGGLLAASSEPASAESYAEASAYAVKSYCGPYGIPLRCCIAKDATNLMMAGRNISATHAALGTIRVMSTTALLGQACGTAAAYGLKHTLGLDGLSKGHPSADIKQTLLHEGCFLPNQSSTDALDLARSASVIAGSSALLHGAGPDDPGYHQGLAVWKDQVQYEARTLDSRKGQIFAVGREGVQKLSVCLTNSSTEVQQVGVELYAVDHIWDYRVHAGEPIAVGTLQVSSGEKQWVDWDLRVEPSNAWRAGRYLRLDVLANPHIQWHVAGCVLPGHFGTYQIGKNKMRRFGHGAMFSFRVLPGQGAYGPEQVITGVTRPHRQTNLWRSDPGQLLPQWLELRWDAPQSIGEVRLTFPGHLFREYHGYAPFYRDPQCPADYDVEALGRGQWRRIIQVKDNYQRLRVHRFDAKVETDRLRILVTRTNGDPSAAIYEVRCYG